MSAAVEDSAQSTHDEISDIKVVQGTQHEFRDEFRFVAHNCSLLGDVAVRRSLIDSKKL